MTRPGYGQCKACLRRSAESVCRYCLKPLCGTCGYGPEGPGHGLRLICRYDCKPRLAPKPARPQA